MLIVPFFGDDVLELSATLPGISTGTSDSTSVSPSKGLTSGTGSPGRLDDGCSDRFD